MPYLTDENEIKETINELTKYSILWLDTEIADWDNPLRKRLSLVQVSGNPEDSTGEEVYLLDLLDKEHLIHYFVNKIMVNDAIEKVFHNAAFDVQYLGGKYHVRNITCTFEIAKKIPLEKLGTPNRKLKTLAEYLCKFQVVENEQGSDWSQRPLTSQQIKYATMDIVFLTHVHRELLRKSGQSDPGIFIDKKQIQESNNDGIENLGLTPISSELEQEHQPVVVQRESPVFQYLTIQNIRLGLECPRLLYLVYHQGGESYFYRDSLSSQTDEKFNQLFNKLTDNLQSNPDFLAILSDYNSLNSELIGRLKT